ncbi:MAG: SWIM zinc finger family protein, partial [Deltaproteobacteria bacterium]
MSRADLLALSPETVATLANAGLVKRAQREIAAGQGPALSEDEATVVTGTFPDGAVARLAPDRALEDTACTCGATGVCRHRVAVALAYGEWHRAQTPFEAPAEWVAWSPGAHADEALVAAVGGRTLERARAQLRVGVDITITRPTAGEPVPAAHLAACTVRFLVPEDLAYARCDCTQGTACEHVVLAVWAFRDADARGVAQRTCTVSLGGASAVAAGDHDALTEAESLARDLLASGLSHTGPEIARRVAHVRARLQDAGHVWPLDIVDELERSLEAYHARSARYSTGTVMALLTELAARLRAAHTPGDLPRRVVLGSDESHETRLDHVRLVSLGAHVDADQRARTARVYLADPDTATVLVLDKRWECAEGETPDDAPALGRRTVAARIRLD